MTPQGFKAQFDSLQPEARDCPVQLLGIRGYDYSYHRDVDPALVIAAREDFFGIYEDALVAMIDGKLQTLFPASTDPGLYYIQHPLNPAGCALLRTGLWWYCRGQHKGRDAFIQAADVTIDRVDARGNVKGHESGDFGIHIHSGGSQITVGSFSAGCQVIFCPEGSWGATWQRFYTPIADALVKHGIKRFPYLLVDRLLPAPV